MFHSPPSLFDMSFPWNTSTKLKNPILLDTILNLQLLDAIPRHISWPVTSLGYQGGAKSFLRVTQICSSMSNTFKVSPTYFFQYFQSKSNIVQHIFHVQYFQNKSNIFFQGGRKSLGGFAHPAPPW